MKIKMMKKMQVIEELDKLGYELDLHELTTKDLAEISAEANPNVELEVAKRRSKEALISDLEDQGIIGPHSSVNTENLIYFMKNKQ